MSMVNDIEINSIINLCTNFQNSAVPAEDAMMFAWFDTGCAMIQTTSNGWILTGPLVLRTDIPNLTFTMLPGGRPYAFLDVSGNVITNPVPGEAFFIRVPSTTETYMLTLYAVVNNCLTVNTLQAQTQAQMQTQTQKRETMAALRQMARVSGRSTQPLDLGGELPDCYEVFAKVAFNINQRPVRCRRVPCFRMPSTGSAGSADGSFMLGCCGCCNK